MTKFKITAIIGSSKVLVVDADSGCLIRWQLLFASQTKEKDLTCRLDVLDSIMPVSRRFLFPDSQAGVFHVISRLAGRAYFLEEGSGREEFVKMMRAYEDVCGVEVLT